MFVKDQRAVIYARVSTEEQLEGYSIAAQLDICRQECAKRNWKIAYEFVEEGESAKSFVRRPEWQKLKATAKTGAFDILICHKIDRFSRSGIRDSLNELDELSKSKVSFVSASEPLDFTTPYGELMLMLFLWFAKQYIKNLSAEVTKGKRKKAQSGLTNAITMPFGYERVVGSKVPIPVEALKPVIPKLFEMDNSGLSNDSELAQWLRDQGFMLNNGKPITRESMRIIMTNRFYAGYVRYRGMRDDVNSKGDRLYRPYREQEWIRGLHAPMITDELFKLVQAARKLRNNHAAGRKVSTGRIYLLKGIAICAGCGRRMTSCTQAYDGTLRYQCRSDVKQVPCSSHKKNILEREILSFIDDFIQGLMIDPVVMGEANQIANQVADSKPNTDFVKELIAEMKRLDYMFQKGRLSEREYSKKIGLLEAQIHKIELQVLPPNSPVLCHIKSLLDAWKLAKHDKCNQALILKTLVQGVQIDCDQKRVLQWQVQPEFTAYMSKIYDQKLASCKALVACEQEN